jgi:hypothetical protein
MDVRDAIKAAKDYVANVYADERVMNIGLEETEFDEATGTWSITIGFSRPWNALQSTRSALLESLGANPPVRRSYKVVHVNSAGQAVSMSHRKMAEME